MANEEQNTPEVEEEAVAFEAEADVESTTPAEEVNELDALKVQLEEAQKQLVEVKDQALRTVADAQNVKRRAEKEVESARKFALEKFASELLAVADNMERALETADADSELVKPLVEGVELTQKTLLAALNKFNVDQVDPAGEPFDPQLHQAMSMVENPDVEPNTVIHVMQKGYTLNGRLLRPAMVMVSKAAASVDEQV